MYTHIRARFLDLRFRSIIALTLFFYFVFNFIFSAPSQNFVHSFNSTSYSHSHTHSLLRHFHSPSSFPPPTPSSSSSPPPPPRKSYPLFPVSPPLPSPSSPCIPLTRAHMFPPPFHIACISSSSQYLPSLISFPNLNLATLFHLLSPIPSLSILVFPPPSPSHTTYCIWNS